MRAHLCPRCRELHKLSSVGSHLLMTCPPTPSFKQATQSAGVQLHHRLVEEPHHTQHRWAWGGATTRGTRKEDLSLKEATAVL